MGKIAGNSSGFSLVELLVVASIIGILVIVLGFQYYGWVGESRIEGQIKTLYSDLMEARTRAMTRNRMHFVVITANNYTVYEDTNENFAANPGAGDLAIPEFTDAATGNPRPKTMQYTHTAASLVGGPITFDTKGLTGTAITRTISVIIPGAPAGMGAMVPDFDCVLVGQSRIRMGRMTGGVCAPK